MDQSAVNSFFSPRKRKATETDPNPDHIEPPPKRIKVENNDEEKENIATVAQTKKEEPQKEDAFRSNALFDLWKAGEPVPYLAMARAFEEIRATRSKLVHKSMVREYFRALLARSPDEVITSIYLFTNKLGPSYLNLELGIGESIIKKAIGEATGKTQASIQSDYVELGDLGLVCQQSSLKLRTLVAHKHLTLASVFEALISIAKEKGNASQKKKQNKIKQLLVSCRECESLYIIRALIGKLRINLGVKSVVAGLAHAFAYYEVDKNDDQNIVVTPERLNAAHKLLKRAFNHCPNWELVIPATLKHGLDALPTVIKFAEGLPAEPMLAQPTKGAKEILRRLEGHDIFTAEYKYDGERAQVHYLPNGESKVFSRNLEDNTGKYPDIIKNLPNAFNEGVTSFVLDCEAVAYDKVEKKILPFQVLSTRARKDVTIDSIKVQVCLFVFDIMSINGESVLHKQLFERREILRKYFHEVEGEFIFATAREFSDTEELEAFMMEAIDNNTEGLMVKTYNKEAEYEPAKRSYNWLKMKKDYVDGLTDSVDLVPIAAWYGKGKRTGIYGAYLLAVFNEDEEEFQCIAKAGSGFSNQQLVDLTKQLKAHVIPTARPYYLYDDSMKPDVWFDTQFVWEVLAADFSLSPKHKAGLGLVSETKGISLRFPRFLQIREDKKPEQATSSKQIVQMYRNQKINHTDGTGNRDDDEDEDDEL